MGSEGGKATLKRHGKQHFAEIGRRGFEALVNKWFGGSKDEAINWLHSHSTESQIDRLLSAKHDAQIADGATITCTEMPVFLDADSDPFFDESSTKWRDRIEGERKVTRR